MPLSRCLSLPALVAAAVLVAGCTAPAPAPAPAPANTPAADQNASAPAATPSGGVVSANPERQGATDVGIDLSDPPAPLASVKVPYSGEERITDVTIDLIELRKRDKLLYGIFRVTPTGDFSDTQSLYNILGAPWAPSLLDVANLKEYQRISEITSNDGLRRASADQSLYAFAGWAYPEGAETVDIRIGSGFPLLEGIPVP